MIEKRDWSGLGIDFSAFDPLTAPVPEPETLKLSEATDVSFGRFREWWWDQFNHGADGAEFNAESAEAASELLPILRKLVWPDFQVEAVGSILRLARVCERHYPASDVPDEDA